MTPWFSRFRRPLRGCFAGSLGWSCQQVFELLFPWHCVLCGDNGRLLDGPLCAACRTTFLQSIGRTQPLLCPRCALPVGPFAQRQDGCAHCRAHPLGLDRVLTLGLYEGAIRHVCLLLKNEHNAWLAPCLADLLLEVLAEQFATLPRETWVVPIPLHWRRQMARGYNQSRAIAVVLAKRLNLKLAQPLRRIRATGDLKGMNAKERAAQMAGAFAIRSPRGIKGQHILLVDDVLTTGATCGAAARTLRRAGARKVSVAVIGRDA